MPFLSGILLVTVFLQFVLLGAPALFLALAIPYAILRLRDTKNDKQDSQLGIKAALYFFFSVGILLFVSGLTTIVVDLLLESKALDLQPRDRFAPPGLPPAPVPNPGLSDGQRTGLALMVAGVVIALLHLGLVKAMTNDSRSLATRRIFAGSRFAIHGIVIVMAFTSLLIVLFQKDFGPKDLRKALFGVLLVWIPSWALHLVLVAYYSRQLYEPTRTGGTWEVD
jgi:hypothetical protein